MVVEVVCVHIDPGIRTVELPAYTCWLDSLLFCSVPIEFSMLAHIYQTWDQGHLSGHISLAIVNRSSSSWVWFAGCSLVIGLSQSRITGFTRFCMYFRSAFTAPVPVCYWVRKFSLHTGVLARYLNHDNSLVFGLSSFDWRQCQTICK